METKNAAQLINATSGETDYWTPPEIIEAARDVMHGIELDPATSKAANRIIKAERIFTRPDFVTIGTLKGFVVAKENGKVIKIPDCLPLVKANGKGALDKKWDARSVWMNHPFAAGESPCKKGCKKKVCRTRGFHIATEIPSNGDWIDYLSNEYLERRTVTATIITYAVTSEKWFRPLLGRPQCFLYPRTNYYTPDGKIMPGVTKGSVVTYFGSDVHRFASRFHKFGTVKVAL